MDLRPPSRGLERLTDLPVALALKGLGEALGWMGPRMAYRLARLLGDGWYLASGKRRRIALRNLQIAFREALPAAERARVARQSCRHALATAIDIFLRDGVFDEALGGALTLPEEELVTLNDALVDLIRRPRPRGLVVLSAHMGDWEMAQYCLALKGLPVAAVARLIHNPRLDRMVTRLRTRRGATVIPKTGALLRIRRVLAAGGAAGLMADHAAPHGEPYLPFFGVRAATYFQYARMLARVEPEVAFVVCLRDGFRFRFRLEGRDLTGALRGPGGEEERAERLVQAYLSALEDVIRAHPEQYLWMHRRWKYRPPGAPDLYQRLDRPLDPRLLEADAPLRSLPCRS